MKLNSENLARQSIISSQQCLQNHFTKEVMPNRLSWQKFQLFLQQDTATLQLWGQAAHRCSKDWGLTKQSFALRRYKAADGQTRCMRQPPGREGLLQEPVLIQPSSSQNGCQRHRASGSLWAASPTKQGSDVHRRA